MVEREVLKQRILEKLREVKDPEIGRDLVSTGMVRSVEVSEEGDVTVELMLTTPFCPLMTYFVHIVEKKVREVEGVRSVRVKLSFGLPPELLRLLRGS